MDSSHDSSENDVLFVKIAARVLGLQLDRFLGPNGQNVVSGSQTPRSINFLRFHDFIGFIS